MRRSHNSRFKLAMGAVAAALALVWATQGQRALKPAPVGQPTAPVRPIESAGRSRNLAAPEAPQAPERLARVEPIPAPAEPSPTEQHALDAGYQPLLLGPLPAAVQGRVVDHLGAPVTRFKIGIPRPRHNPYTASIIDIPSPCDPPSPRPGSQPTLLNSEDFESPDGTFRYIKTGKGDVSAAIYVKGREVKSRAAPFHATDAMGNITLRIPRPTTITGTVFDTRGMPSVGASVTLSSIGYAMTVQYTIRGDQAQPPPRKLNHPTWEEEATTSKDGCFTFEGLTAHSEHWTYELRATTPEATSLPVALTLVQGADPSAFRIQLVPSGRLRIHLTRGQEGGREGDALFSSVVLYSEANGFRQRHLCTEPPTGADNDPPVVTAGPLECGAYLVEFSKRGPKQFRRFSTKVEVLPNVTTDVFLEGLLASALTLHVQLDASVSGAPQRPTVGVHTNGLAGDYEALVDGRCELSILKPSPSLLILTADVHREGEGVLRACVGSLEFVPEQWGSHTVHISPGTGTVHVPANGWVNPMQKPHLARLGFPGIDLSYPCRADGSGYTITNVSPGRYRLGRPATFTTTATNDAVNGRDDNATEEFEMKPGGTVNLPSR